MADRFFAIYDSDVLLAVARVRPGAEEAYTDALRWEPCDVTGTPLGQPFSWRGKNLSREELPDERTANELLFTIESRGRELAHASDEVDRYAIFSPREKNPLVLDNAYTVIRRVRPDGPEERFDWDGWHPAEGLDRILGSTYQKYLRISAEEMEQQVRRIALPQYSLVRDTSGQLLAVVRELWGTEEAFTRDLAWGPSDLLSRSDLTVERITSIRGGPAEVLKFAHTRPGGAAAVGVAGRVRLLRRCCRPVRGARSGPGVQPGPAIAG